MRYGRILLLLALVGGGVSSKLWGATLAGPFSWTEEAQIIGAPSHYQMVSSTPGDASHLWLRTGSAAPAVYTLRTLGPSIVSAITSNHYAVLGHIEYHDVAPGSFLELENWFKPAQPGGPETYYYSRTLADAGPMARIEGAMMDGTSRCPSTQRERRRLLRAWC